jgi:hypothetical protein
MMPQSVSLLDVAALHQMLEQRTDLGDPQVGDGQVADSRESVVLQPIPFLLELEFGPLASLEFQPLAGHDFKAVGCPIDARCFVRPALRARISSSSLRASSRFSRASFRDVSG